MRVVSESSCKVAMLPIFYSLLCLRTIHNLYLSLVDLSVSMTVNQPVLYPLSVIKRAYRVLRTPFTTIL